MIIPSRKGQYFKIWDKVSIGKLQNEHHACSGHYEESIKNMFFCVELCLLFSAGQLINSMRMRYCRLWCRHLGRPPDTEPWSCHWNQWTLMKSKIHVTISMKSMQIKPLPPMCVGSISKSVRLIIGRSWVQSLAASYQKTLKGGSCCYPVWRSTFERDRATSTWRCSVAAGPTINWAKRISKKDFPFRIFHFGQ